MGYCYFNMKYGRPGPVMARWAGWLIVLPLLAGTASGQLRVVTYNTAGGPRSEMEIVFRALGEEERNGIAKPIDVLLVQEQTSWNTTTQDIVNMLNGMYGAGTYGLGMLDGGTMGSGRPGLVYNTSTVQLIEAIAFGELGGSLQARQTLRYQLRPVGFDSSADFYAYNSHYKADTGSTNEERRLAEATAIREDADALGEGAHIVYAGDHNMYRGSEPAFQTLIGAGAGQAFDPINRIGDWTFNSSFADVHTQAPCLTDCILTGGGMDDRFDFQLVTGEFLDGEGLSYVPSSYRAFGNNGSTFNTDINAGCDTINGCTNTYVFSGVTSYTKKQILDALKTASDHIPVVADYQLSPIGPQPETIVRWTFETGTAGNPPAGSGTTISGISPATGMGTASGVHASAATVWDNPAGNGSPESFSSNNWAVGDFYQFQTSTDGLEDISLVFDQVSSGTGPRDFQLSFSSDGTTFTDFGSVYMVRANSSPGWSSGTALALDTYSFDLSSVTALNDQENLYFRLVVATNASANGGSIGTGGTSRLDNVTIFGTPLAGIPGDYNDDGTVDAADYVVWRTNEGTQNTLPNDPIGGAIGDDQYNQWASNFGATAPGSGSFNGNAVPEPCTWLLVATGACLAVFRRGRLKG